MRLYETMYVVHPALESGRLDDIINEVEKTLTSCGGEKKGSEVWGKRKLAYMIDKQKYGTYVLLQFSNNGKALNKFNSELKHNPNILTYLTTSINEEQALTMKVSTDNLNSKDSKKEPENKTDEANNKTESVETKSDGSEVEQTNSTDKTESVETKSDDSKEEQINENDIKDSDNKEEL
tara:strand:+ start:638 stop:1174 length:537 start_codon:yes stop_codon:yes gene_type:complete